MSGYMTPVNPVVGGTVLRRAAIQSPNYVAGSAGWTINQDGSAEFNNVTIRGGTVEDGIALYYSGTPALGNLVVSIAAAAGTDALGNAYLAGLTTYTSSSGVFYAISLNGQTITLTSAVSAAGPYSTVNATLALDATFTNLVITSSGNIILTPQNDAVELPILDMLDQSVTPAGPATGVNMFSKGSLPRYVTNTGPVTGLVLVGSSPASTNAVAVTQAAFNNLTSFSIIANDAQAGSIYRVTVFGYGNWGSTQTPLTFQARFGAAVTTVVGTPVSVAAAALAVNAPFFWKASLYLICLTTGTSATWRIVVDGVINQTANALLPGTAADNVIPFVTGTGSSDVTLDSTVTEVFGLSAKWGSASFSASITKIASMMEKLA